MSAIATSGADVFEASMNAMVIYDEGDWARQATALLARASERADATTRWRVTPWRADLLNLGPFAQEALREAAGAHLIVLAVGGGPERVAGLLGWLEAWAAGRQVQDAALAVFEGASGDTLAATATPELSEFAQRHGLSFIFGDVNPVEAESARLKEDLHQREVALTPTIAHMLEQAPPGSYQHWGINE
jgi:hypothetical protein